MNDTDTKNILVYVETSAGMPVGGALEALAGAREMADGQGGKVLAVLIGTDTGPAEKVVIAAGADTVLTVEADAFQEEVYAKILTALTEKYHIQLVLAAATQFGKDLIPMAAKACGAGCVTDVMAVTYKDGQWVFTCPVYGGNVLNDVTLHTDVQMATPRSGAFSKKSDNGRKGEVVPETVPVDKDALLTRITDRIKEVTEAVNLEEAEVIVAGGRGMGSKEGFEMVKELARVCGGVVGATRPAIEDEWIGRSHQVGQSGKIVAPKLYIACGISGATQHVSGMIGSGYIVAINKDEDAPIFDVADVGIVGDVHKILPLMIEAIQKAKA